MAGRAGLVGEGAEGVGTGEEWDVRWVSGVGRGGGGEERMAGMRRVSARPRLPPNPKYEPSIFIFSFIIIFKRKNGSGEPPVSAKSLVTGPGERT